MSNPDLKKFTVSILWTHSSSQTLFFAISSALNFFLREMNDYVFQLWYYSLRTQRGNFLQFLQHWNLWSIDFWKVSEAIQLHFEVVLKNFVQLFVSVWFELLTPHCHSQKRRKTELSSLLGALKTVLLRMNKWANFQGLLLVRSCLGTYLVIIAS